MKKIVSFVGVSAMVLMLGLGPGFAQQTTSKETPAVPAVTQVKPGAVTDVEKEKTLPAKPGVDLKSEKGTPVPPSATKAGDKTGEVKAAVGSKAEQAATAGKEAEKVATPKPNVEVKPEKAASVEELNGRGDRKDSGSEISS